jgi:hypothetical protein
MIELLEANLISPIFDPLTVLIIAGLLAISSVIYYLKRGYNHKILLFASASVIFIYAGILFLICGCIVFGLTPVNEVNNITINSTQMTQINLSMSNLSDPLNTSQNIRLNTSNFSSFDIEYPSFEIKPENPTSQFESLKKLGGGLFGNGLGLIGLALALIGLGFYNKDRIENEKNHEEIIAYLQKREYTLKKYKSGLNYKDIYTIGEMWLCIGLIFTGLRIILFSQLFVVIPIVGVIILIYGYFRSKTPQTKSPECTFDEMIQKIRDQSCLKKN